jgi:predicted nucleic acid-binding protein
VTRYTLDSNLYIEAARDAAQAEELEVFSSVFLPFLYLHAIVVQELLAGATSSKWQREIQRGIVRPFERRNRLIVPAYRSWRRSGEIVFELVQKKELTTGGVGRSFMNDALLAASCREAGVVLITRNLADFQRIALVEPVRFQEPWPEP